MSTIWQRDPRVLWRRSAERMLLAVPGRDEVLVLEGTAALTWELLADPVGEDELVGALSRQFAVDIEVVRRQVVPFLQELSDLAAIERRSVACAT